MTKPGKHKAVKAEVKAYWKSHFTNIGSPIPIPGEWKRWHRAMVFGDRAQRLIREAHERSKK